MILCLAALMVIPYSFTFADPFTARFIRITMIGTGFLHLDEIEVYGDSVLTF